jgi:cell wall-associated NlpC family hydrolase
MGKLQRSDEQVRLPRHALPTSTASLAAAPPARFCPHSQTNGLERSEFLKIQQLVIGNSPEVDVGPVLQVCLPPMRTIAPTLLIAAVLLMAANAYAIPQTSRNDLDELTNDKSLLTQIDHVRQSVTLKASELVVTAMGFLGVPYRRGGNTAETGFDCSGFVRAMYEQSVGLLLPRRAEEQAAATQHVEKNDLQPGDLVFFNTLRRTFSHVGIYVGNGKFIHSPKSGAQVRVENMGISYWQTRFNGARRVAAAHPDQAAQVAQALQSGPLPAISLLAPAAVPSLATPYSAAPYSAFAGDSALR